MESVRAEIDQVNALKQWCKKNSSSIFFLLAIIFGSQFAWNYYHHHLQNVREQASIEYDLILNAAANPEKDIASINSHANNLIENYPKTTYAALAALFKAKIMIEAKEYAAARENYNWIIERHGKNLLANVARLRKARVLMLQEDYDAALAVINKPMPEQFQVQNLTMQGDIYTAKQDFAKAKDAYKAALANEKIDNASSFMLKMKLAQVS